MPKYIKVETLKQQDFQDYSKSDVEYAIDNCPTEDVVPRSEVEKIFDKYGNYNFSTEQKDDFNNVATSLTDNQLTDVEHKLAGVMHSVDKWLDGDELNQDEVNRAITMREKTLNIIEDLTKDRDGFENLFNISLNVQNRLSAEVEELQKKVDDYERICGKLKVEGNNAVILVGKETEYIPKKVADCFRNMAVKQAKREVAREIIQIAKDRAEKYINDVTLNYHIRTLIATTLEDFLAELKKKYIVEKGE